MALTQLSRRSWQAYFDRVAAALAGRGAHVEPAGLGLDEAAHGQWVHLVSLSYDAEPDELALTVEGARRLIIRHPRQVHVHQDGDWLHGMEVLDAEGERHFLVLRSPLQVMGATV